jgi:hypothetical protein
MKIPNEEIAIHSVVDRLAKFVGISSAELSISLEQEIRSSRGTLWAADGIVKAGSYTFVIEYKKNSITSTIHRAISQVTMVAQSEKAAIPLLLVPFMGDAGKVMCADAGVAWMDLSGNACIYAPGLSVYIEGKPNLYKRTGRPSSVFAPKSSRIVHWLLLHPTEFITQREICRATDTGEGYTSTIVSKLEKDNLIMRNDEGAIRPRDPALLLDAWREFYDFSKHHIIKGSIATRSSNSLLKILAETFIKQSVSYALTGLAAAWLLDQFAGFRLVTFYLATMPSSDLLKSLDFREVSGAGANVWFVIPKDAGVFHGAGVCEDISCVDPVQIYLDLKDQPERSKEAAQRLRKEHLNWSRNDR